MENKTIQYNLFNLNGHLNEEGTALYAEALSYHRLEDLPVRVLNHMENCVECKTNALEISELIDNGELPPLAEHPYFGRQKSKDKHPVKKFPRMPRKGSRNGFLFLKIAAGILVVSAISIVLIIMVRKSDQKMNAPLVRVPETRVKDTVNGRSDKIMPVTGTISEAKKKPLEKNHEQKKVNGPGYTVNRNILADVYEPYPALEKMLLGETRGFDFKILSPAREINSKPGQNVIFKWESHLLDNLVLTILDNRGVVRLKTTVSGGSYSCSILKRKGLFYWTMGTEEEYLAGGKILLRY